MGLTSHRPKPILYPTSLCSVVGGIEGLAARCYGLTGDVDAMAYSSEGSPPTGRIDMATAAKLLVAAACAGLVACGTQPPVKGIAAKDNAKPHRIRDCRTDGEDRCDVIVTVKFDLDNRPYLVVSDDDMFLLVKKNKKPKITWTLQVFPAFSPRADDFEFDTSTSSPGIDFGPDGGAQIPCSKPVRKAATCVASQLRNTEPTAYKYTVNVIDTTKANTVYPLDPWVVAE